MKIIPEHLENFKRAIEFYEKHGFKNIEVPWFVGLEANNITMPSTSRPFKTPLGYLVGSAEQSFFQMMLDGNLSPGKYQALTPCFRDEKVISDTTLTAFMKLELIDTSANLSADVENLTRWAECFMLSEGIKCHIWKTNSGYDLMANGIELGSYGMRNSNGFTWAYGTGLAEPRFTIVKNENR